MSTDKEQAIAGFNRNLTVELVAEKLNMSTSIIGEWKEEWEEIERPFGIVPEVKSEQTKVEAFQSHILDATTTLIDKLKDGDLKVINSLNTLSDLQKSFFPTGVYIPQNRNKKTAKNNRK